MPGFIGQFHYSVDHKGRLSLPAKMRRVFRGRKGGGRFFITKGLDGCLFVFPASEWEHIEGRLRQLHRFENRARFFVRSIMSNASEARLDAQGRISIPQTLRETAHIKSEVLIIGALDRIELWDPETFRSYNETSGQTYEAAAQDLLL